MEPRLKSSKQWTAIPSDYIRQVKEALVSHFPDKSKTGEWIMDGRIYSEELLVRMGYHEEGKIKQITFELSTQYVAQRDSMTDLLSLVVDVAANLLETAFSSATDDAFPRAWQEYAVEKKRIFIQYSAANTKLEQEASRLLGETTDVLVRNYDDEEVTDVIKSKLGVDDQDGDEDEDDEDDGPVH
jgi:hypothetical protein